MKSAVEPLGPTRVKLTVEVPFAELKGDMDHAYKHVGGQVRVPGFRPGKVPPRIIDQRIGRGAVLEHAVNDAVPRLYGEAVRENEVQVVGQPEIEVTAFADGGELAFTAEVDIRPEISLPDYDGLAVTVDDADVDDAAVDENLGGIRERFAVLSTVERPVETGDYVSLDLAATVDGEEVPGSTATNLSHEVGSDALMPGLDDALVGASAGETRTFDSELTQGDFAGRTAQVTATVRSVKHKDLPELDDDFAQTASEFDSIAEFREDVRTRLSRIKRMEQGLQARDRALETLLGLIDIPLPESLVASETQYRIQDLDNQLEAAGMSREEYLAGEGRQAEEFESEVAAASAQAVKAQFVLEAVATAEELNVSEAELTDAVVRRARQAGMTPDAYARALVENQQLPAFAAEIVRGKALATVLEKAAVTDASGRPVDLDALSAEFEAAAAGTAEGFPVSEGDLDDDDLLAEGDPDEDDLDGAGGIGTDPDSDDEPGIQAAGGPSGQEA